jgi:hypothetical protein
MSISAKDIKDDNDKWQKAEWLVFIETLETFIEAIIADKTSFDIEDSIRRSELRNDLVSYLVDKGISAP